MIFPTTSITVYIYTLSLSLSPLLSFSLPLPPPISLFFLTDMSQSSSSKAVEKAKVIFEYEADNPDELTIKVGEIVEIVNKNTDNDGWWEVSLDFVDSFSVLCWDVYLHV